ncbi:MAG: YqgE/AlgH family protein [Steroidobacteraceae bacterium]
MAPARISTLRRGLWLCGAAVRSVCALVGLSLLVLSGASSIASAAATSPATVPAPAPGAKPLSAILITARDALSDPFFADSIVLVMNNLGPAPVGIIVNRPTRVTVSHLFPNLKQLENVPEKVYFGGPVDLETVWFLIRAAKQPKNAVPTCDGVYLSADRSLLMQLLGRAKPMEGLRIFAGHAGWAPGQLQEEIGQGAWHLERADAHKIFDRKSEHPFPSPQTPKPST